MHFNPLKTRKNDDVTHLFINSITNHDLKNQVQDMLLKSKNINQNRSDIIKLLKKDDLNELKIIDKG